MITAGTSQERLHGDEGPQVDVPWQEERPLGSVTWTDQQLAENEERVLRLVELISGGEAFAIVGAGSSVSAGYPTWVALLQGLADLADECSSGLPQIPPDGDKLAYAQAIRDWIVGCRGQEFFDGELAKIFVRDPQLTPFHDDLLRLPFRGFGTTNYDSTLRDAAIKSGRAAPGLTPVPAWNGDPRLLGKAMRALNARGALEYIIHFHGLCTSPRSIVLSTKDYQDAYGLTLSARGRAGLATGDPPRLRTAVSSLLSMRQVVFVGFSLEDPFVKEVLMRSVELFWGWDSPSHFAIMPIWAGTADTDRNKAERLRKDLGIDTVFYEAKSGDHSERDKLVQRVRLLVETGRSSLSAVSAPTPPSAAPAPARPTPSLTWVETANRAHLKKTKGL